MTATSSPVNVGRSLTALLAEHGRLPAPQAIEIVRKVAEQVAALHDGGRLHLAVTADAVLVDDELQPVLVVLDPGSEVAVAVGAWIELLPELAGLLPPELPAGMATARERLHAAGITLDPRQIDLCQLGSLFCRILTGESAAAYLRSARVKGQVPPELRSLLERALGCDGQKRFSDMGDYLAALDTFVNQPTALVESAVLAANAAPKSAFESPPSSRPAGDTTPSFIASTDNPADTSVGPGQSAAAQASAAAAHPSNAALPFSRLGHYEIVSRIGRGGMGEVYRGYERTLDRPVAIKVLPPDLARQPDFIRRFQAEATAAAKLIHPNILQIFFIGEDAGHHFFAMQYVEGESVADLLARRKKLPVSETLAIVEQALAGLAAAHEQGMVHRDIKPGNILLDRRNRRALLADFGLVKSLESSGTGHTATGVIMGTVDYISPEQGRGLTVDARSDLYSLGVLLYQLLAGRLPFEADNPTALIFQHVYEPPPPLAKTAPDVPASLASMIEKLLAKSPADRYQTADEVLVDFRNFRTGKPPVVLADPSGDLRPKTTIIRISDFDEDEPLLPVGLTDVAPSGWWERTRDRAMSLFQKHAPEVLQQLQNTQQQMGGAVAEYERRCRDLEQLANDAESVLAALQKQADDQRAAASPDGERTAADLDRQIAEQQEQLDIIRLRLAQATARAHELRNQRDILGARMKAARLSAGPAGSATGTQILARHKGLAAALAAGVLIMCSIVVTMMSRSSAERDDPTRKTTVSDVAADAVQSASPRDRSGSVDDRAAVSVPDASGSAGKSPPAKRKVSANSPRPLAIAPFDADQARKYQADWAAWLEVPTEYTDSMGMKFVLVPPGEFTMGSSPAEIGAILQAVSAGPLKASIQSEGPTHQVLLTRPFYFGVREVTQREYETVMGTNPSHFAPTGAGRDAVAGVDTASHPVEMVSWNDAAEFCAKLSLRERLRPFYSRTGETVLPLDGTGYRLPTEAEWEFANRAGTLSKYWSGDKAEDLAQAGWFASNAADTTHAAAQLKANAFGLCDMHGNVCEWVEDARDPSYFGRFEDEPARDPRGPYAAVTARMFRGGGWSSHAAICRASSRDSLDTVARGPYLGFRAALEVGAVQSRIDGPVPNEKRVKPVKTFDDPAFQKWIGEVRQRPAEEQVDAVVRKLRERNADFDGTETHKVDDDVVQELKFPTDGVADISPVRALAGLKVLNCDNGTWDKRRLTDLSPLAGMSLTDLRIHGTKVADLAPLKGMKLKSLMLNTTAVTDLAALKGMPLVHLDCSGTEVSDLSPLAGMPLTVLLLQGSWKIADLSPLTGMKLTNLSIGGSFFVSDLSPLKGMPITTLDINRTKKVKDLSPLRGMRLKYLTCEGAKEISDLTPLEGMPLERLWCHWTSVTDFTPLRELPLTELIFDFEPERDTEILRAIKTLKLINSKPATTFWSDVEAGLPVNIP